MSRCEREEVRREEEREERGEEKGEERGDRGQCDRCDSPLAFNFRLTSAHLSPNKAEMTIANRLTSISTTLTKRSGFTGWEQYLLVVPLPVNSLPVNLPQLTDSGRKFTGSDNILQVVNLFTGSGTTGKFQLLPVVTIYS